MGYLRTQTAKGEVPEGTTVGESLRIVLFTVGEKEVKGLQMRGRGEANLKFTGEIK